MRKDSEDLLEHVLSAVMQADTTELTLFSHLKSTVPTARISALIHALLAADQSLTKTFNGNSAGRTDAALARHVALTLAAQADAFEHDRKTGLKLHDLPI